LADYREYVTGRMDHLRRTAYLLCGNWHTADDLVSTALVKLYRQWARVSTMENVDAYVRRVLVRAAGPDGAKAFRYLACATFPPDPVGDVPSLRAGGGLPLSGTYTAGRLTAEQLTELASTPELTLFP